MDLIITKSLIYVLLQDNTERHRGLVIVVIQQYAYIGATFRTIHASIQLEAYQIEVNIKSCKVPGRLQRVKTLDGYLIPLVVLQDLCYMKFRPSTDNDLQELPHLVLTSDDLWDPTVLDCIADTQAEIWYILNDIPVPFIQHPFIEYEEYTGTSTTRSCTINHVQVFDVCI